ncbi:DNA phosphorothioation-dependent restriction protein DptF [Psychrobacillus sp. NPDC093200]|uniref:DNA phosphorothioation-dependent restriction protein DptF n=1 Tax=Psychrobacillus sp. NPDC093200 TaxID=3390656 RepID=UPI003D07BBAB
MQEQNNSFLFSFLDSSILIASETAYKMEQLIFEDAASAIIKARVFAEEILKEVYKIEKIEMPYISTLKDRIFYLTQHGYIKNDIQSSFENIRRSGNKAAHDAEFEDITVAFQLHKEMFNIAVWFYELYSSSEYELPKYRVPKPKLSYENLEEMMKNLIKRETAATSITEPSTSIEVEVLDKEDPKDFVETNDIVNNTTSEIPNVEIKQVEQDSTEGSYLLKEISRLKDSAKEAIENANEFSDFKKYLHVERKIQRDLEAILKRNATINTANLILLCGSVGDGKSHLLAYIKEKHPELMDRYLIHNDATESFSPSKNALETLEEVLLPLSDENIDESKDKIILAINLGVLHNFINYDHQKANFEKLKKFVEESEIFSQKIITDYEKEQFNLLNFTDYHPYELTENGPTSVFYQTILDKICVETNNNPFHRAFIKDQLNSKKIMVHENYLFLKEPIVQKQIISLVIQTIIKRKLVVSTRTFLNFIADILIGRNEKNLIEMNHFDILQNTLPSLLFNSPDRSNLLKAIHELDPIHRRTEAADRLIIELNTMNDWTTINEKYLGENVGRAWVKHFENNNDLLNEQFSAYTEGYLRLVFLSNSKFARMLADPAYESYMNYLYDFNKVNKESIKEFYEKLKQVIFMWKGKLKKDYILLSHPLDKYKLAQSFTVKPHINHLEIRSETILETFKNTFVVGYKKEINSQPIYLEIDYPLFSLLQKVESGYRPTKEDEEEAINFIEYLEKIMQFGNKEKELLINFPQENKFYKILRDDFGSLVFERE